MFLFKDQKSLTQYLKNAGQQKTGYVPTMGALHEGHLSLINASAAENDLTVCSIFVNPTQFNDKNDLAHYPRPVEADIALLSRTGCSVLFLPSVEEMYPNGTTENGHFDLAHLENILEGRFRPGHFQGVAQIVDKFLHIIRPDNLYIGQKDYQQCMVLKRLVKIKNYSSVIRICPTLREPDGLAMSSRNRRLTESQRAVAGLIYQCLVSIQAQKREKSFTVVRKECLDILRQKGFRPDYIEIADADSLDVLENYDNNRPMVALIAASIGDIRLIDNLLL